MTDDDEKGKKEKIGLVELENLRNLIDLASRTMMGGMIHHFNFKGEHIYYLPIGGIPGIGTTLYFIRRNELIKEKYIVYNKSEDKVIFTDQLDARGNLIYLPIIKVKKQNIFKEEELAKFFED